jgi:hypothetical protein
MDTVIHVIIYLFSALFALLALGLLLGYYRNRHPGMLLMAVIYLASAGAAVGYMHWWPLIAGLVLTWVVRLMGLEPHFERKP